MGLRHPVVDTYIYIDRRAQKEFLKSQFATQLTVGNDN